VHDEVLARRLELNQKRYDEEVAAGLHCKAGKGTGAASGAGPKKAGKKKASKTSKKKAPRRKPAKAKPLSLFDELTPKDDA
jgi:hypothetical protein